MLKFSDIYSKYISFATTTEMVCAFAPDLDVSCSKAVYKETLKKLPGSLEKNDILDAVALAIALIQSKGETAIQDMRDNGMFRVSRYGFNDSAAELIEILMQVAAIAKFSNSTVQYLSSVSALHSLRSGIKPIESFIYSELERHKKTALKSMFVLIDRFFLGNWEGGDKSLSGEHPLHHGIEDFAEAFSTIIGMFRKKFGRSLADWNHADPDGLNAGNVYMLILMAACQINNYRRAEIMLDGLPYLADVRGNDVFIFSIDPLFEKSVRLGYVQQQVQALIRLSSMVDLLESDSNKMPSLHDTTKLLLEAGLSEFFFIEEEPHRRLVFAPPSELNWLEKIIGYDGLFQEEQMALLQMDVDDFSNEDLRSAEIKTGIRIEHILRAQRFFYFIGYAYNEKLESFDGEERAFLTAQSIINFIPRESLIKIISLGVPEHLVDELIDMLTLSEDGDFIDVQYQPLVKADEYLVCSAKLFSGSNLPRNVYIANHLYTGWEKGFDPMILQLRDSLLAAGFKVAIEVDLPFGQDLDADILALRDGLLLVLECKHAYHPCNVHELRNTLWHINKGVKQLGVRLPFLEQKLNINKLLKRINWDDEPVDRIRGAIVTSTRVLHGWRPEGYPVIQAKEFMNVLERGSVKGQSGYYHFWENETLSISDINRYLDGELLIDDQLQSMTPITEHHPFNARNLVFETWRFDDEDHGERLKKRYRFTPKNLNDNYQP